MSETELSKKYLGKYFIDEDGEKVKIIDVIVDYRKSHQHMNRVMDENGNITFINELEIVEE